MRELNLKDLVGESSTMPLGASEKLAGEGNGFGLLNKIPPTPGLDAALGTPLKEVIPKAVGFGIALQLGIDAFRVFHDATASAEGVLEKEKQNKLVNQDVNSLGEDMSSITCASAGLLVAKRYGINPYVGIGLGLASGIPTWHVLQSALEAVGVHNSKEFEPA